MKNLLLVAATMCVAMFLFADTAEAGQGKGKRKIAIQNTNPNGGRSITIFIAKDEPGLRPPVTKADALRFERKNIQAGRLESFLKAKGTYAIGAADTAAFNNLGNGAAIPIGSFIFIRGVVVGDNDLRFSTNTALGPPFFTPRLF